MAESPMVGMLLSGTGPRAQRAEQSTGATRAAVDDRSGVRFETGGRCPRQQVQPGVRSRPAEKVEKSPA